MKFPQLLPVLSCLLAVAPAFSRDFRPATHIERLPAADSSVKECYVIQTTAGVGYTVQSSEDLTTWTAEDPFYGLGGEYVVTMHEFTPAPPLPPGTPPAVRPPPAKNVSLRMDRASGAAGGTVVSWASLDDGGPRRVRIAGNMVAQWDSVPGYSDRFGNLYFFIWHQISTAIPPAENSILGEMDTTMLTALEENLATMNQRMIDSVARARNTPLPGPSAPGSKRFWRILVNPAIDTDSDGSPDWSEFEIAARVAAGTVDGTGVLIPGVTPDPFDSDTNGDGIPDGDQLDGDRDGAADRTDPDSSDNTATFPLGPIPRYALFPITNAAPPESSSPLQISDKGTVLYENGTWTAGVWKELVSQADMDSIHLAAVGINDNNQIIGRGSREVPSTFPGETGWIAAICYWSSPASSHTFVSAGSGSGEKYAMVPSNDFNWGMLSPGPVFSNDGHFSAFTKSKSDHWYENPKAGYWKVPLGGGDATETGGDHRLDYCQAPDLRWGSGYPLEPIDQGEYTLDENFTKPLERLIYAPESLPSPLFTAMNVFKINPKLVIALPGPGPTGAGMALVNGQWTSSDTYSQAIDMSADGTAIGRHQVDLPLPICLNGKWYGIDRTSPDVPDEWKSATARFFDTTPGGWCLASKWGPDETVPLFAVMLPLRAEGKFTNSSGVVVKTAAGVDDVSIGSPTPGDTVKDRIWIMAPKGGPAKQVTLKSPLNADTPLKLSGTGVSFGGTDGSVTLTQAETVINLTAESAASGTDVPLDLKFGDLQSLSKPLGVKVMKRRVVKATIHLVASLVDGMAPNPPNVIPNQLEMKKYLDDIYGPQVNATFDLQVKPMVNLKWDIATSEDFGVSDPNDLDSVKPGNGMLEFVGGEALTLEEAIIDSTLRDNAVDINIYVLGGAAMYGVRERNGKLQKSTPLGAYGYATRSKNVVFIDGDINLSWDRYYNRDSAAENKHCIAHEIGHLIINYGHPDEGGGPAPLPGLPVSAYPDRLMTGGGKTKRPDHGKLLVKGEWDAAELWFVSRVLGDN